MTIGLGATQQTGPFEKIILTLRLIEAVVSTGGKDSRASCYQTYCDTQTLSPAEGIILGEENPIPITFQLPEDAHTTSLSEPNAWYWELTAEVPTAGVDFKAEFLIPVYQRSSSLSKDEK